MSVEKIQKKTLSFSDEEEESDLIINNDEFCVSNDFKVSFESNFLQNKNNILKQFNLDKNYNNEKITLKNQKYGKHFDNVDSSNGYGTEEKTIFSKIAEDLYINSLSQKSLRKNLFDINEMKDDNYNKLTAFSIFPLVLIKAFLMLEVENKISYFCLILETFSSKLSL